MVSTRKRKRRYFNTSEEIGVSYEEEKMLNLAIKNSIREQKAGGYRDFTHVKDMKVFYPTEIEFKDPIKYFENLYQIIFIKLKLLINIQNGRSNIHSHLQ